MTILITVHLFIAGSIPFLLATFGMLYFFYRVCHPWLSEGISVGFEPGRQQRKTMMDDIYVMEDNKNDNHDATPDERTHNSEPVHLHGTIDIILLYDTVKVHLYIPFKQEQK